MKNFTIILGLALSSSVFGAHQGELAIISTSGDQFYVLLNGEFQNFQPQTVVNIKAQTNKWYNIKILSSNNSFVFERNIPIKENTLTTYAIVKRNGFFSFKYHSQSPLLELGNHVCNPNFCNHPVHEFPMSNGHPIRPFEANCQNETVRPYGNNNHFRPNLMDNEGMNNLMDAIRAESFSSDQLSIAIGAAKSKRLSVHQIIQIADLFTFSKEQLSFTKAAYKNCVNKQDYYLVMKVFTFSSDKKALQSFIDAQ